MYTLQIELKKDDKIVASRQYEDNLDDLKENLSKQYEDILEQFNKLK